MHTIATHGWPAGGGGGLIPSPAALLSGGGDEAAATPALGLPQLVAELVKLVPAAPRSAEGSFLFAIDHCFAIRGHGTVLTGTVMQVTQLLYPRAATFV